ncbi:tRNA-(ms[2]io[6]A)-hydroxylase [Marinibactrum halimedae]|uniref:Hydroxylase n=1 Tax=Marinibactrum halimedae TaxID=1444977 RepID=A0AA37T419_9GAMM|nr:tRNA-(ms[2]io[6]A)-hydroxylase [Marinibactrum halimedae]MCD9460174.1 tRNA-(ms[2]io[6]A)-hydroxylase [Marinibactrum halimedae]GLS26355.1 hydroxylase [Marinibactrum halimedae]
MSFLRFNTPKEWTETVLENFDDFLLDHAAAEKKASGMAVSMLSHYPDRKELVEAMIALSIEEMTHFREVVKLMHGRGLQLGNDSKDPYINELRKAYRKGSDVYMLDRLLIAGIIEARGCERFGLIGEALPEGTLKNFYVAIAESESRHHELFIDLARQYFFDQDVDQRLDELLDIEADIVRELPLRAALH